MATPNDIQGLPDGAVLKPVGVAAQTTLDPSQIQGLPAGAILKPMDGASDTSASAPAPGTTGISGFLNQVGEGGAEAARDIYGVVKPLAERAVTSMIPGAPLAQAVQDAPGVAKTVWNSLPPVQLADSVKQILPLVDTYEKARANGKPISDAISAVNDAAHQHSSNISQIQPIVDAFKANPTRETARALLDASAAAASLLVGGEAAAPEEAAAVTATKAPAAAAVPAAESESLMTRLTNPFRKLLTTPKEAGVAATQEPGATAIRTAVGAPAGAPIVEGSTSVADDLLSKVGVQKDTAYKRIDDAVGFDLKAEKKTLDDTRYAIKQPGADKAALQKEINASVNRIADANKILVERGINPKTADQLNTSWEAAKTLKNDIVRSTGSDGTINVKQLLTRGKNARFNPKYGDRLAQAFGQGDAQAGKAIADQYMQGLEAAQKAGVDALKAQRFKLWLTGLVGGAVISAGGYEGVQALLAP